MTRLLLRFYAILFAFVCLVPCCFVWPVTAKFTTTNNINSTLYVVVFFLLYLLEFIQIKIKLQSFLIFSIIRLNEFLINYYKKLLLNG